MFGAYIGPGDLSSMVSYTLPANWNPLVLWCSEFMSTRIVLYYPGPPFCVFTFLDFLRFTFTPSAGVDEGLYIVLNLTSNGSKLLDILKPLIFFVLLGS